MSSDPTDCALIVDGDLIAAATLRPRPQHATLNDVQAQPDGVEPPTNLVSRLQNEVLRGRPVNFRVKQCVFTSSERDGPELAAHKTAVRAAMKRAGFNTECVDSDHATAADATIAVRIMKVLFRQTSVAHFVVLTHSADVAAALTAVQDEGKTSTVCVLTGPGSIAAMDDFMSVVSSTVVLNPVDLFALPFYPVPPAVKLYRYNSGGGASSSSQQQQQSAAPRSAPSQQQQQSATPPASHHYEPVMPVVQQPPLRRDDEQQPRAGGGAPRAAVDQMDPTHELAGPATTATAAAAATTTAPQAAAPREPSPAPSTASNPPRAESAGPPQPPTPAAPAVADRPAFDMPLPAGVEVHWSPQYKEWYYTVRKTPESAPETTWIFPGPREKQMQLKIKVLEWKAAAAAPADRPAIEQQLATLRVHLQQQQQQQGSQPPSAAASVSSGMMAPVQQAAPGPQPQVAATYTAVPPNAGKNMPQPQYQQPQQQPQQQQQYPPQQGQQQQPPYQQPQQQQQQPPQQGQPQYQQPPQQPQHPYAYPSQQPYPAQPAPVPQQPSQPNPAPPQGGAAAMPPAPQRNAVVLPDATLPPGWEKWGDAVTGQPQFYVDRNVTPARRVDTRPPF